MNRTGTLCACFVIFLFSAAAFAEAPPGFRPLIIGQDLTGWKGLVADPPARAKMKPEELAAAQAAADQRMKAHWKVEDGALVFDGKGDSLCTAKDYGDFELLVDWKILDHGDSGLYVRGSPQIQIWDPADHPEGSGGLYNNQKNPAKPSVKADRPIGEWNSFRIRMVGDRVTVYLNDVLVVDEVILENYWERDKPIYTTGSIELQNHGNTLYFRNIYIRELPLHRGARVAITGDSITEQRLYSKYIEDYLLACVPELDLRLIQLGWSGERAPGFAARLENDLLPYEPDVVTTCYGMNDGQYRVFEDSIGEQYNQAMSGIVKALKAKGVQVVVGSPGAVDTYSFKRGNLTPKDYNDNLGHLRDIARKIAGDEGMLFANVHDAMIETMAKAKSALGEVYDVCGADGFHPQPNGHIVMAYAFLKSLGLDGRIGSITIDLGAAEGSAQATASPGHRVLSASAGKAEIESSRYPFCFYGDAKSPGATRSIAPFVPFNQDLNRFMLQVKNLKAANAKVSWGAAEKSFSREELEKGVNLAAEFPDNPFSEPFQKLDGIVARKQAFETNLIKGFITQFRNAGEILGDDPEGKAALEALRRRLLSKQRAMQDDARRAVAPVRHTLAVMPN